MESLLRGAYDLHVHCSPDIVPRAQDMVELAEDARRAGMAGLLLKDHTTSTVGRAHALNRQYPEGPHFFSALALNPPVGSLNPYAVEAALREGADVIYFPTYGARHHINVAGASGVLSSFPRPQDFAGTTLWAGTDGIKPEVMAILELIAEHDAVLATGHLSAMESIALVRLAQRCGVRRMIVTHASDRLANMTIPQQLEAVARGAYIEHCGLTYRGGAAAGMPPESIVDQIRQVGMRHVILSSDHGQLALGPIVAGFAHCLALLQASGLSEEEIRVMIVENPRSLLQG